MKVAWCVLCVLLVAGGDAWMHRRRPRPRPQPGPNTVVNYHGRAGYPQDTTENRITLFQGANFGAPWIRLATREDNLTRRKMGLPRNQNWNDRTSSVWIHGTSSWKLCVHAKLRGRCVTLPPGKHAQDFLAKLGNDVLSSLTVLGASQPPAAQSCSCQATGDPHYKTYDGQVVHFQGTCRYTLTETTVQLDQDKCAFKVEVANEHRGNPRVSYTRLVYIHIQGHTVTIGPKKRVQVNGIRKSVPYHGDGGLYTLSYNGRFVMFRSTCGLIVKFDGTNAYVTAPGSWREKLTGICGDCNGKKDDYRTKGGQMVGKKFAMIGNSYVVKAAAGTTGNKKCEVADVTIKCQGPLRRLVAANSFCGLFKAKNSVFGRCLNSGKVPHLEMYESCVIDVCAFENTRAEAKNLACKNLEALVDACTKAGFGDINWRRAAGCPMKCDPYMVYNYKAPSCAPTCADPRPKCTLPPEEGCICSRG